jgi:opacity protein-like surface antigen
MKVSLLSVLLLCLLNFVQPAVASDFHRAGMFDLGGVFQGTFGDTVKGNINGTEGDLELDDLFAGGVNFGYHITDYLRVSTDLLGTEADLRFKSGGVELHEDAPAAIWTVNLDYYILPTRFTPFLSAGVGLLSMDNRYNDDWCCCCYPDHNEIDVSEVDFLWNLGAGLRWDPMDHLYIKLAYRLSGTELQYGDKEMLLHSVMLTVGYTFKP